jgi:uncharacterized membrane protein
LAHQAVWQRVRRHPQLQQPELAPPEWKPSFTDYLYLSFTNAVSFAASDVTPLPAGRSS